ncbi:hypothetical protein A3Q56_00187 [Intoshia linei]|uniref:Homeobox domain-containing protein n=1 Tax=Intoshia linei TaxID=1819745 RepID=A0A177BCJ8_9BILA|nr:hypothetical protein A3Q56_00187 [Intoshia linei]
MMESRENKEKLSETNFTPHFISNLLSNKKKENLKTSLSSIQVSHLSKNIKQNMFYNKYIMLQKPQFPMKRRRRTIFKDHQLEMLESTFSINQYPDIVLRLKMAMVLGLQEERIESKSA